MMVSKRNLLFQMFKFHLKNFRGFFSHVFLPTGLIDLRWWSPCRFQFSPVNKFVDKQQQQVGSVSVEQASSWRKLYCLIRNIGLSISTKANGQILVGGWSCQIKSMKGFSGVSTLLKLTAGQRRPPKRKFHRLESLDFEDVDFSGGSRFSFAWFSTVAALVSSPPQYPSKKFAYRKRCTVYNRLEVFTED